MAAFVRWQPLPSLEPGSVSVQCRQLPGVPPAPSLRAQQGPLLARTTSPWDTHGPLAPCGFLCPRPVPRSLNTLGAPGSHSQSQVLSCSRSDPRPQTLPAVGMCQTCTSGHWAGDTPGHGAPLNQWPRTTGPAPGRGPGRKTLWRRESSHMNHVRALGEACLRPSRGSYRTWPVKSPDRAVS